MKYLGKLLGNSVLIWSVGLLSCLTLASIFYHTRLPMDGSEMAIIEKNNLWFWLGLSLFGLVLFLILCALIKLDAAYLLLGGFLFYLAMGIILIIHQNNILRHDALAVLEAARAINRNEYSPLTSVYGYIFKYPHQLGLVTFERIFLHFFGEKNVQIFFYINLVFAMLDNLLLYWLVRRQFPKTKVAQATIVLSFLFLPQIFYILFVYGLTYSLFFVLLALLGLQAYLQHRSLLASVLTLSSLSMAYLIRSNNLLLLLSICLLLFLDFLQNHYHRSLLLTILVIVVPMGTNWGLITYYKDLTGAKLQGEPKIAWIAMGLDDNPVYNRIPGWYDAYVENVYTENEGNAEQITQASQKKLGERLQYMKNNPAYTIKFFKNKLVSTWTDGLFQSVWSGPLPRSKVEGQKVEGSIMTSVYEGGRLLDILYVYSASLLPILYGLSLLGTIELFGKYQGRNVFLAILIYLSAGFLFHLIWETKSQYVYPYVYLLIPIAGVGFDKLYKRMPQ
ncbi:hypothetical protein K6V78_07120 [Streptococcus gallolyticus]|uniref:hypothetical protein n=1 Tax=Streptococcus hepaticus TaxID=3349163 RepID=UPI001C939ECB|nr:hypothetical protein [Streptococcus gallolyticus]MBY5041081.1 hypothetical protein [Streptococcus gallolyticus]